ncbi:MAG: hypothetical protein FP816_16165 [Desulfobacteraceae bacterium]|nr:hypothetical protein [Desulfobacteraceae bacterium]
MHPDTAKNASALPSFSNPPILGRKANLRHLEVLTLCLLILTGFNTETSGAEDFCPPLASPTGAIMDVDSEEGIRDAVNSAPSGTTIAVADGTYHLGQNGYYLWMDTPGVTLRSASGDRDKVIFDDNYSGSEMITVAASNITIAEISLKRAGTHPIHVVSTDSGDVLNTLIYRARIIDPGQQAIKINPHSAKIHFPDDGVVACCTMELTDEGRAKVWEINGSCYTGGVDGHQSRGWVVRDNTIEGFWCHRGLSEHGVHFWTGSRDTLVERNLLMNNARGIGFGLTETGSGRTYSDGPCPDAVGFVGHYDGMIRNNFIFADSENLFDSEYGADGGIALAQACGARVLHNTIAFIQAPFAAIEWRFSNTSAIITNNLVSHNLMDRGGSSELSGNLSNQPLALFVDTAHGNLHLKSTSLAAINQGAEVSAGLCDEDIDGETRPAGTSRDVGADEYSEGSANSAPMANNQSITVETNSTAYAITLSGSDPDQDVLTFAITIQPANGHLEGIGPDVSYTPDRDFTGSDTFRFRVNDGALDSSEATVSIMVRETDSSTGAGGGGGCFIHSIGRVRKIL